VVAINILRLGGGNDACKDDPRGFITGGDHHVGRNAPTGPAALHENSLDVRKKPETYNSRAALSCGLSIGQRGIGMAVKTVSRSSYSQALGR
jgi:hypothetical protein